MPKQWLNAVESFPGAQMTRLGGVPNIPIDMCCEKLLRTLDAQRSDAGQKMLQRHRTENFENRFLHDCPILPALKARNFRLKDCLSFLHSLWRAAMHKKSLPKCGATSILIRF